jgi:hypothetical protein
MEILNFLRDDPVMAGLVLLGLALLIVSVASVYWRSMAAHGPADAEPQPVQAEKPARFGSQTDLIVLLFGVVMLLGIIGWIHSMIFL